MFRGDFFEEKRRDKNKYKTETSQKSTIEMLEIIKARRSVINMTIDQQQKNQNKQQQIDLILPRVMMKSLALKKKVQSISMRRLSDQQSFANQKTFEKTYQYRKRSCYTLQKPDRRNIKQVKSQEIQPVRHTQQLFKIIQALPTLGKQKNQNNLLPLTKFITQHNPLFKKTSQPVLLQFLKHSRLEYVKSNKWIYKKNDTLCSFFIILLGKVKIINTQKSFKKYCSKGQTLSQQILFTEWNQNNQRDQGAKTLTQCFLLQISYKPYFILYKTLILKGHKSQLLSLQSLIKRNYLNKQNLRRPTNKPHFY